MLPLKRRDKASSKAEEKTGKREKEGEERKSSWRCSWHLALSLFLLGLLLFVGFFHKMMGADNKESSRRSRKNHMSESLVGGVNNKWYKERVQPTDGFQPNNVPPSIPATAPPPQFG